MPRTYGYGFESGAIVEEPVQYPNKLKSVMKPGG